MKTYATRLATVAAMGVAMVVIPTYASADSSDDAPSASETVAALQSATPEVLADAPVGSPEPVIASHGGQLMVQGAEVAISIATNPAAGFTLAAPDGPILSVTPLGVDGGASDAKPVAGGEAVVATGTDPGVSTVIKPTESGLSTYTVISGPDSPETYSWQVAVDQTVELSEDGGAVVMNAAGEAVSTVDPPWAKGQDGRLLEGVRFEASGRTLKLVVPHRSQPVAYNVVVDPVWFAAAAGVVAAAARQAAIYCGGGVAASAVYSVIWRGRRALQDIRNNWQRSCVEGIIGGYGLRRFLR